MKARWIFAGVAVLVAVALLWMVLERRAAPHERAAETHPTQSAQVAELESALTPALEPVESVEERTLVETAPPAASTPPDSKLCEIRGRFLFPGGAPAAGVPFELHGWESNEEDVKKYGRPDHWEDLSGETDADGRFSVRFDPPRAYQFTLEAKTPGYAGAEWRWSEILAGAVVDLGEVELVQGGTVEGRIVDAEGNVVLGGEWLVYARSIGLREFDGRDETQVTAWADPATGTFRVEDVMPGRVELKANDRDWTEETIIQVKSGETVEADIAIERSEKKGRIILGASWKLQRLPSVDLEPEHVSLTGTDGMRRAPSRSYGSLVFEGLDPGEYRLTIDDPRFRPWSETVRPGAELEPRLEGTSALELRVRDIDGAPVEHYALNVQLQNVHSSPDDFEVPEAATSLLGGVLAGLIPGDYRITVRAGEHLGSTDVDGLAIGETRAVEVLVGAESVVSGRVRYSDGEPAAEVDVALLPAVPPGGQRAQLTVADRALFEKDVEKQVTDERGAFRFVIARPGEYLVWAALANGSEAVSEVLIVGSGSSRDGLELVLPRGGFVTGRIQTPSGASCAGLRVWIGSSGPMAGLDSFRSARSVSEMACELGPDGHFELGPIPPGSNTVFLLLPVQKRRMWHRGMSHSSGVDNHVVLGTVEVADGKRVERDLELKEFPGTVAVTVLVNGEAVAGVSVELRIPDAGFKIMGETDARGQYGPALAFPGSWTVSVVDPELGWCQTDPTPVLVSSMHESQAQISVEVSEASLVFLDAENGTPLAGRFVSLRGPEGCRLSGIPVLRRKTDTQGRASWTLASGDYRFRLDPEDAKYPSGMGDSGENERIAPVTWTLEGPLVSEIRL